MNVWYCHHYAGSKLEADYGRAYFLAKALIEEGHSCRVITSSFNHLMRSPVDQKNNVVSKKVNSVNFTWLKVPKYIGNGAGRFANMLMFALRLRFENLVDDHEIEKPDVIIISSTHPFHIFAGAYWAKKYHAKLIFEVRDLWPLSLIQILGISEYHPLSIILNWVHKFGYRRSDQVVSLLPNAQDHMAKMGLTSEKFNYIPNGIDTCDENFCVSTHYDFLKKLRDEGAFIFMYAGAHGVPNALEPLLEAAKLLELEGKTNIHFVLIGEGIRKEQLIHEALQKNLKNVHFLPSIPRSEMNSTLQLADLVFVGGKNIQLYDYGVSPNKLFEYMFASKPILMTISSPNNPLEMAQAGTCLGSNDPQDIANAIIEYYELPGEELVSIGMRGKQYVESHHCYKVLARQYIGVMDKA